MEGGKGRGGMEGKIEMKGERVRKGRVEKMELRYIIFFILEDKQTYRHTHTHIKTNQKKPTKYTIHLTKQYIIYSTHTKYIPLVKSFQRVRE